MKICSKCKIKKPLSEFNFKNKGLDIKQKSCKICTREQIKAHYYKNKEYYLTKSKKRNAINRQKNREYLFNFLSQNPCIDCGETDPVVLEFDHQNDKSANISHLMSRNYPLNTLKKELAKCEVRCANCHRRKTAKDFNWYKQTMRP